MSRHQLVEQVLAATPTEVPAGARRAGRVGFFAVVLGVVLAFTLGGVATGWSVILVGAVLTIAFGVVGVLLSAVFQLTNARWGRAYRRLAEGGVVFMPVGLLLIVVYLVGTALTHAGVPWSHAEHLSGGKEAWLVRGFWDARILISLALTYGLSLLFLYYSLRRDFCVPGVAERLPAGWLARRLRRGIGDADAERGRCEARLALLAPVLAIVSVWAFSLLGFDLIMALEPGWFSTLFGAWYFIGQVFAGLALLAIVSLSLRSDSRLEKFLTEARQRDLATLLFAFCLLNTDFFWSQYLTIWYANLPEETFYLSERALDDSLPWFRISWVSLCSFFVIPFVALLFRRVKGSRVLLAGVSVVVIVGIFLARFLEIAPALMKAAPGHGSLAAAGSYHSLVAAALLFAGCLGVGWQLYRSFLTLVPILPVGDDVFVRAHGTEEDRQ